MLGRVDEQVAQNALDPAAVGFADDRFVGQVHRDNTATADGERLRRIDDSTHQIADVECVGLERRGARVVAADLQQVAEQRLEAVELGLQQLRGSRARGVEVGARLVQDVGGHPHGRQRRPQLVRDVGDEPALNSREFFESVGSGAAGCRPSC